MKGIIANPGVGPHVQQTLKAYQDHQLLNTFYTTFYYPTGTFFDRFLNKYLPYFRNQLQRRQLESIDPTRIKSINRYELLRIASDKLCSPNITDLVWEWGELAFDRWVATQINSKSQWVHGYEHCSLATLLQAKKSGVKSFYEQPSQHFSFFENIARDQLHIYPELRSLETQLLINQKSERRNQRRAQELNICDYIICNSTFTKKTLTTAQVSAEKIITIPLGFPAPVKSIAKRSIATKTIFMCAGNQSLRKGTHLLYQAWKNCNFSFDDAELWIIGSNQLPLQIRNGLGNNVKFIPNLPHAELIKLMAEADLLVLPTLCDGFGMVITEAMAQGLPVITTSNSGGPDIITAEKDGFLLDAGNVEQLSYKLKWCVIHKNQLKNMGINALEKAKSYPWASFRKQLITKITDRVATNN
ncbi:MAG: glycosyltransferase family 4 protein [Janthinobacterium lividum]